jgi:chemotaxis protein MotB
MNLFGVMEIGGSALGAERLRAEVVASNMANLETTHTPGGGPYRRRLTVFRAENASPFLFQLAAFSASAGPAQGRVPGGVRIANVVTDTSAPVRRYQPGHPDADKQGYVAYSSSQVDHRKVGKLALAIQVAFQELGVFQASGTAVPLQPDGSIPPNTIQMLENVQQTSSIGRIVSPAVGSLGGASENGAVAALQKELEKALAPEIFRKDIALRHEPDGLVISLREVGFFPSGSAELRPGAASSLRRVTEVLMERPYEVRIEGHTDNVPIHTAQFASNWELSTARAIEVVRLMIAEMGFAAQRLSVGGYGEFHPVAPNSTEEQRALNRRVDVVILRRSILAADAGAETAAGSSPGAASVESGSPGRGGAVPALPRVVPALPGGEPEGKPSPAHPLQK